MTFQTSLEELSDPTKRLSSKQLVDLSNLDANEASQLAEVWGEMEPRRRLGLLSDLIELSVDNVELNFDTVFKQALEDEDARVRTEAIHGLIEYEERDLIRPLATMLREDPDNDVRREAAIALGRFALAAELGYLGEMDGETVKDVLMESTEDMEEDERIRARAIEALGAISGEDMDNLIESVYAEESPWLKIGAVDAMGRSANDMWLPIVLRELTNPAPQMRHAAAFALGEIGEDAGVEPLKQAVIQDPDRLVRETAVHALAEISGGPARVALKSLLFEADDDLREQIQEALTELALQDDPLNAHGF